MTKELLKKICQDKIDLTLLRMSQEQRCDIEDLDEGLVQATEEEIMEEMRIFLSLSYANGDT